MKNIYQFYWVFRISSIRNKYTIQWVLTTFFYFPTRLLSSDERRLEEIFSLNFNTKVWGCLSRIIHDMKILYLFLVCLCLNVQKPCLYEDLNFRKVVFHTSTVYKGLLKNVANNFKKLRHSRYELGDERLNFMSFF